MGWASPQPPYQYHVGDVIKAYDGCVGMIVGRTNAADYMAYSQGVEESIIRAYSNIPIYKILMCGRITIVNESNIESVVQCGNQIKNT